MLLVRDTVCRCPSGKLYRRLSLQQLGNQARIKAKVIVKSGFVVLVFVLEYYRQRHCRAGQQAAERNKLAHGHKELGLAG